MKFYTCQIKYDEIYYDTRLRLETVCREENKNYWGTVHEDCYIAVTKVTMEQMSVACAVPNNMKEEMLLRFIKEMMGKISGEGSCPNISYAGRQLEIKEVTLNAFIISMKDNGLAKLFSERSNFCERIGIDENSGCYKEYLLDKDYWNKKKRSYKANILPEEERMRIKERSSRTGVGRELIPPVDYVIYEEDMNTAKIMAIEIIYYLCAYGRVNSRRLVKIDSGDAWNLVLDKKIQNLNNLDGGIVVLKIDKRDSESEIGRLLRAIYTMGNSYSEKYTAIIIMPMRQEEMRRKLRECCPQWVFFEVCNKKLNQEMACQYFKSLMKLDKIESDDSWKRALEEKDNYTNSEVFNIYKSWVRNVYNIEKYFPQYKEVVDDYFASESAVENAKEELENLIGLSSVKQITKEIVDFFKLQRMRNCEENNIAIPTMHMVFYGNPGTAKTTVARLIAKILKEEKILEGGEMFEVGRSDLVGKYVGWTAKTVKEYFEKAKGSVLFIDEAYSLIDEQHSFGDEAISTIVQEMENHRNDVAVIMAGYKENMRELLDKNQGLRSRISFYIDFPDYSKEELYQILLKMIKEEGMTLASDIYELFCQKLDVDSIRMGNGRLVRNILDRAKMKQAVRVLKLDKIKQKEEMFLLRPEDFDFFDRMI